MKRYEGIESVQQYNMLIGLTQTQIQTTSYTYNKTEQLTHGFSYCLYQATSGCANALYAEPKQNLTNVAKHRVSPKTPHSLQQTVTPPVAKQVRSIIETNEKKTP